MNDLVTQLANSNLVSNDAIVIAFHSIHTPLREQYESLSLIKGKKYGDTAISIYGKETES
jgi:hypothetical protein